MLARLLIATVLVTVAASAARGQTLGSVDTDVMDRAIRAQVDSGARLPDPHHLLRGSGARGRGMRLESTRVLERPEVKDLISAALAGAKPMPRTGRGKLIIQSISAKQRPRQKNRA